MIKECDKKKEKRMRTTKEKEDDKERWQVMRKMRITKKKDGRRWKRMTQENDRKWKNHQDKEETEWEWKWKGGWKRRRMIKNR